MFSIQGDQVRWDEERDAAPMAGECIEHQGKSYVVIVQQPRPEVRSIDPEE